MAIDVENPGGFEAALKAAMKVLVDYAATQTRIDDNDVSIAGHETRITTLEAAAPAGSGVWELLSSATVTTPVEFLDIALPTGYSMFKLTVSGFKNDTNDTLAYVFSGDGGSTFYNNQDTFESYSNILSNGIGAWTRDVVGYIGWTTAIEAGGAHFFEAMIWPGGVGEYAGLSSKTNLYQVSTANVGSASSASRLIEASGRMDVIRITLYGSGDVNPPSSGEHITAGTFVLEGMT